MAVGKVGEIFVKISGDDRSFNTAMKRTTNTLKVVRKKVNDNAGSFAKWGAITVAAAGAVAAAMVKGQMKVIDSLAKTSDALKVNQERLQALQHVGELTGTSAEQLNTNLERMQRRLGNVARGQGPTKKALEDLGIEMENLVNIPVDQQLVEISRVLGNVENAATRASIANDIFGRDGVRMLKMLEQLKDEGLEPTVQELESMGVALSRIDSAKVEAANDAMFRLEQVTDGITNKIAVELSPLIQGISDEFLNLSKESKGFGGTIDSLSMKIVKFVGFFADVKQAVSATLKGFEVLGRGVLAVVAAVAGTVGKIIGGVVSFAISGVNKAIEAANKMPGVALDFVSDFGQKIGDESQGFAERFINSFKMSIDEMESIMNEPRSSEALVSWLKEVEKKAEEAAKKVASAASGGGGSNKFSSEQKAKLDILRESLKTETKLLEEKFKAEKNLLKNALAAEEITKLEHKEILAEIDQRNEDELTRIKQESVDARIKLADMERRQTTSGLANMFDNLSQIMNTGSKKMFAIGKAAAKAGAIVKGYQAAVDNYQAGSAIGGPILGAAFAATSLAATGAQIAQINSQKFGGGNTPTSFRGGQPSVNTNSSGVGPQSPSQNINIALNGSSFGAGGIRGLISEINDALGDGVTLNVQGG